MTRMFTNSQLQAGVLIGLMSLLYGHVQRRCQGAEGDIGSIGIALNIVTSSSYLHACISVPLHVSSYWKLYTCVACTVGLHGVSQLP